MEQNNNEKITMEIIQGSTPTITCSIPDTIDLDLITNCWLFISQKEGYKKERLVVDHKLNSITIDKENRTISTTLSQEETLSLNPEASAVIQIQFYMENGKSIPSKSVWFNVIRNYKGEVISDAD